MRTGRTDKLADLFKLLTCAFPSSAKIVRLAVVWTLMPVVSLTPFVETFSRHGIVAAVAAFGLGEREWVMTV
jgi:hypothetical protein